MAPTIPNFCAPRGQCAATAISVSSSGSDSVVILSSATFSTCSVVVVEDSSISRGGGEARGRQRSAPWHRHRRPPLPAPSTVPVRSSTVVTAASSANGGGNVATSRRLTAAPHQCPSSCSVLSIRAPGGITPAPTSSGGGSDDDGDEATSKPKRKAKYRKWDARDELKILTTLAELRSDNLDVLPPASILLQKICDDGGLLRRGVDAPELSVKVHKLKKKFKMAAFKLAAGNGGRRRRKHRDKVLFEASMKVWHDLLPRDVAAAVQVLVAGAARRHL